MASPTERLPTPDDRPPVRATVTVVRGPDRGAEVALGPTTLRVGAASECDLVLVDEAVSGVHVALTRQGGNVVIEDLGSTNGTRVGRHEVAKARVPLGSMVRIGRTDLHLRSEDLTMVIDPHPADHLVDLHGGSVTMRFLYALICRVAPTEACVFVDGETGTGKELVARAVHGLSHRARGPFVVFDGSAVSASLAAAHLFGHARGAFTGAERDRAGVFEEAKGGTVFLDEVDSLPADVQPRLLRVLEAQEVTEVKPRPVDVRVVVASRSNPEEAVVEGSLREDLYFRLAVVRLTMPRLADRIEDLPQLVRILLERHGSPVRVEPGAALDRLGAHPWPGNVRELRNALERALALAPADAATLDDLPIMLGPLRGASSSVPSLHLAAALQSGQGQGDRELGGRLPRRRLRPRRPQPLGHGAHPRIVEEPPSQAAPRPWSRRWSGRNARVNAWPPAAASTRGPLMQFWSIDEVTDSTPSDHEVGEELSPGVRLNRRAVLQLGLSGGGLEMLGMPGCASRRVAGGQGLLAGHDSVDDFVAQVMPRARALIADTTPDEEAYLAFVSALLARVDAPPPWSPSPVRNGRSVGLIARYPPIVFFQIDMEPRAVIDLHDHRHYNGVLIATKGSARCRNFDIVPPDGTPLDVATGEVPAEGEDFLVRQNADVVLRPGQLSRLTRERDNIHHVQAGDDGATLLDFFTYFSPEARSYGLEWDGQPYDEAAGLYKVAWKDRA